MSSTTGDVQVSIIDNGGATILVARQGVVAMAATSSAGTAGTILPTRDRVAMAASLGYGRAVQLGALLAYVGATPLIYKLPTVTLGSVRKLGAVGGNITNATNATPIVVTTTSAHGLSTGDVVTVAGVTGNTGANGTRQIIVTGASAYSLVGSAGNGAYVSGGTTTDTGLRVLGTATPGTFAPTVTLDGTSGAFDDACVKVVFTLGGTIGVSGISYKVSYDAGRNYGPTFALGTGTSIVLTDLGVTIGLTATQTIVAGDTLTFGTIAPESDNAGISAWLTAMATSTYASSGKWGHMVAAGEITGAKAATYQTALDALITSYDVQTGAAFHARDASPPHAYGGTGETDAVWSASIVSDFSVRAWRREQVSGGHYNIPSPVTSLIAGAPSYRRPASWAASARRAIVEPQINLMRVKDSSISTIVVDPTNDPNDGFVYHEDHISADILDTAGFLSLRRRPGKGPSFFVRGDNTMAPVGSDFALYPTRTVFDNFTDILKGYFNNNIGDTFRWNANGTVYSNDINTLESGALYAVAAGMPRQYQPSGTTIVIDPTYNSKASGKVRVTGTLATLGIFLEFDLTLQVASA